MPNQVPVLPLLTASWPEVDKLIEAELNDWKKEMASRKLSDSIVLEAVRVALNNIRGTLFCHMADKVDPAGRNPARLTFSYAEESVRKPDITICKHCAFDWMASDNSPCSGCREIDLENQSKVSEFKAKGGSK